MEGHAKALGNISLMQDAAAHKVGPSPLFVYKKRFVDFNLCLICQCVRYSCFYFQVTSFLFIVQNCPLARLLETLGCPGTHCMRREGLAATETPHSTPRVPSLTYVAS